MTSISLGFPISTLQNRRRRFSMSGRRIRRGFDRALTSLAGARYAAVAASVLFRQRPPEPET